MRDNIFETSDFYLAVTLLSLGYTVVDFDVADPNRVVFIFEQEKGLSGAVEEFWSGRLRVNPKILFMFQKELKGRMSQLIR